MKTRRAIVGVIGRTGQDGLSKRLRVRCGLPVLSAGDIACRIDRAVIDGVLRKRGACTGKGGEDGE